MNDHPHDELPQTDDEFSVLGPIDDDDGQILLGDDTADIL